MITMVRTCKRECLNLDTGLFSDKQLSYDEGSYCKLCEVWIKVPTIDKRIICPCCGTCARRKAHHIRKSDDGYVRGEHVCDWKRKLGYDVLRAVKCEGYSYEQLLEKGLSADREGMTDNG
jgi:hypothetical protein